MCDHFVGTLGFDQVFLTLKSFVCVCVYKKSRWWDFAGTQRYSCPQTLHSDSVLPEIHT